MARGVLDLVGLAATLAIAVPIGFMGVDMALSGRPLGYAFLAVAAAAVVLEEYVTRPTDLPGAAVGRVVGAVAKEPGEED